MPLTGNQIREKFLAFFESRSHARVASSSLIPFNDPTLFFTNAGMVQFKDVFTGLEKKSYTRATTSQKCLRVSGKHNDLENVGRTPRHHTFFEMLGNFSFGDYFKKEAIAMAWEFLTKEVSIPKEYLWVTVFREDDEAEEIWRTQEGVPAQRIVRLGEKDNFWSMGETGPCGPCSEIHIDLKQLFGQGVAKGNPGTNEDDFMEIWNLVFMQFDRDSSGKLTPLPKPSIDTGMGLERLCTVLQKKTTNYDTDLFSPLIDFLSHRTGKAYGSHPETDVSLRVLADHARAGVFLVGDGVLPSNEGRGYVLRRIMRRAIRHGRLLGMNEPFFNEVIPVLIKEMGKAYPDLIKNQAFIIKVIKTEEEKFLETLEKGLAMIEEEIATLKKKDGKVFSGELAFKLYDTFGFPSDLTELIAQENDLVVDMESFEREMKEQKTRARKNWKGSGQEKIGEIYHRLVDEGKKTKFVGYETLKAQGQVMALAVEGQLVEKVKDSFAEIFVDATPFYGESGGQVGDQGKITGPKGQMEVEDTQKRLDVIFSHQGKVKGEIAVGQKVDLEVLVPHRRPIMLNHTATHILHAALREVLGDHIKQAGSLVEPHRLRFDFTHFEALTPEQLAHIETRVNEVIQANYPVTKVEMPQEEALKKGAIAFFGDKYGDRVRVVTIGPYSMELCGGTHLDASGEIGLFKIISESSVASGVRRIEATTGMNAFKLFQEMNSQMGHLAALLKALPSELPDRIKKINERVKTLEKELALSKSKLASGGGGGKDYMDSVQEIKGVKVLTFETSLDDMAALRDLADQASNKLGSGITVIGSKANEKATIIVKVSKDLSGTYHAGNIVRDLASLMGGKGGGRPDMAQAGGEAAKLSHALGQVPTLLSR